MDSRGHQRPLTLKGIVLYTICKPSFIHTMYCKMTVEFCSKYDLSQCHSLHSPPRIGIFLWWLVSKKDPWSRKCVIFKLKSNQKCYIFGDFLNCTMFNSSMWGSLTSLKVRQCRNVFFSSQRFFQKTNEQIRVFLPYSTMIELFRLFFGRIRG